MITLNLSQTLCYMATHCGSKRRTGETAQSILFLPAGVLTLTGSLGPSPGTGSLPAGPALNQEGELLYLKPEPVSSHGPADGAALEGGKLAGVDLHVLDPQEVGRSGCRKATKDRCEKWRS